MNKNDIKVSVIVPVYNVEPYIRQCLDSLIEQTLKEIEIIVVDDGSPDKCGVIIDEYALKDQRVKVIHKINGGVSAARNDGIKEIKGEYVFFCDSDDWLSNDALEVLYLKAKETDSDVVMGDFCEVCDHNYSKIKIFSNEFITENRKTISIIQNTVLPKGFSGMKSEDFSYGYCLGAPWHHLIRASIIQANQLSYDTSVRGMFDDGLFMLHIFEFSKKVSYISHIIYYYRVVGSSITHKFNPNILDTYNLVYQRLFEFGKKYDKDKKYLNAVYIRIYCYLNKSLEVYFLNKNNELSDKKKYEEFVSMIKTEPYRTAINKVKLRSLYYKQSKILIMLLRMRMNRIYWWLKKGKEQKK